MSDPPVPTCPRCRYPVNAQAHACHNCGCVLGGRSHLSPPIPYHTPPRDDRWPRLKASLLNGFGGTFAVGGALMSLLCIVMAIFRPGSDSLSVGLISLIVFGLPPLIAGLAMMNGARNIRKELAPPVTAKPEDQITQTEREIEELLKKFPKSQRDQAEKLERETTDLVAQLRAMETRRAELNRMAEGMPGAELDAQRASIQSRLETEADPFIQGALRQQLEGIEGQLEARQSVETSCARLNAAYDAALQTLRYLRAELQASTALASNRQGEALQYDAGALKSISDEIARTRSAGEEVIRLTQE